MARQTGVFVDILDTTKLARIASARLDKTIDPDTYQESGVIARYNPTIQRMEIRTINTEGVQDRAFNINPETGEAEFNGQYAVYTWYGWHDFTREELMSCLTNENGEGTSVDLSEFVRVFGQRLETNFSLAYAWVTEYETK